MQGLAPKETVVLHQCGRKTQEFKRIKTIFAHFLQQDIKSEINTKTQYQIT